MTNSIRKNAILMMLALGLVFTAMVPGAMAQERCRTRSRQVAYYDNNNDRYRNDNPDYRNDDRYRNNNPDYRNDNRDYRNDDRYDSRNDNRNGRNGRAVRRVGIGAAGGAIAGGLLGGRKGLLIGGIVGAAGGYVYHRNKENQRRY